MRAVKQFAVWALAAVVCLAVRSSSSGSPMEGRSGLQLAYLFDDGPDAGLVHEIEAVHLVFGSFAIAIEETC